MSTGFAVHNTSYALLDDILSPFISNGCVTIINTYKTAGLRSSYPFLNNRYNINKRESHIKHFFKYGIPGLTRFNNTHYFNECVSNNIYEGMNPFLL